MVFLSYAREDGAIAERLRAEIERYGPVFFDTLSVRGGAAWEREIDTALRDCSLFLPIVSPRSNESDWVARETLLAIELNKPILPALVAGEMPLRLIDRQHVDCRGNFESAVSDVLEALARHGIVESQRADVDGLLADAVKKRLAGEIRASNALAERAVLMDPALAPSAAVLWRKLLEALDTDMAAAYTSRLRIVENAATLDDAYEWSVALDAEREVLDSIDSVTYTLHPTFPNPLVKIRSPDHGFRITRSGRGRFTMKIHVEFVDNTAAESFYLLTLEERNERDFLD